MACLELRQLAEHEYLFYQGDPFDGLYFVASGQVSVVLELNDGQFKRLRTYTVGNTIGEMGLYRQTDRMASVVADKPSSLYFLSAQTFEEIEASDPVLASNIHRFIVNLLAERLQHREEELKHLIESV
nr:MULTISPECIES: cyclic nucleotide-binding domain-containing protein [unclassified Leptolyngbya]